MPHDYEFPSGASGQELDEFEVRTGLRITSQLREWLATVNGAMVGPGGLFGVRPVRDVLSIEYYLKIYPEWCQDGWLPIASDGLGNFWIVAVGPDGSGGWVAFVNTHNDPDSIDYYVASTVFRFLDFILRSELGERGWPESRDYVLERDPDLQRVPESLTAWGVADG